MHKLTITPAVESVAKKYSELLLPDAKNNAAPRYDYKSKVVWLRDELSKGKAFVKDGKSRMKKAQLKPYIDYLDKIIAEYDKLLVVKPGTQEWLDYERDFTGLLDDKALAKVIHYLTIDTRKKKPTITKHNVPFHEAIVEMMGYKKLQKTVFPSIIEELEIKTCVYCNAQYAIVVDDHTSLFQLDHCLPKSIYPYLCTSFYNLQPCCGSCNQRKLNDEMRYGANKEYNLSIWQSPLDPHKDDHFHFHIDDANLALYIIAATSHDKNLLKMQYVAHANPTQEDEDLHKIVEQRFHITNQYNKILDVVEETVWKHQIYSAGYVRSLNNAIGKMFPDMKGQVRRIISGTYDGADNIYKRPLTKMIHDVIDQLDGLKKKRIKP